MFSIAPPVNVGKQWNVAVSWRDNDGERETSVTGPVGEGLGGTNFGDDDLVVLGEREGMAHLLGQPLHHGRRLAEHEPHLKGDKERKIKEK